MIPTPDYSILKKDIFEHIYEPAEDTFILLDALESEKEFLTAQINPKICLEIGSGSGCVITFLAKILSPLQPVCLATDLNPYAVDATVRVASHNHVCVDAILCNLVDPLLNRVSGKIDVLLFNPPYVETADSEIREGTLSPNDHPLIYATWAGGIAGRNVMNRILYQLESILSPGGCFYMVAIDQNSPQTILKEMRRNSRLESKLILKRKAGIELLYVLRFRRIV